MGHDYEHWVRNADDWIAWARAPNHDAFWAYRDQYTQTKARPGRSDKGPRLYKTQKIDALAPNKTKQKEPHLYETQQTKAFWSSLFCFEDLLNLGKAASKHPVLLQASAEAAEGDAYGIGLDAADQPPEFP
jgi:hypothetical protein